jgi:hypothetical protein
VLGIRPVRLLVKDPVPAPLLVVLFAVVGLGLVLQHTPRAVMAEPPSLLMLPPLLAVVAVMALAAVVLRTGIPVSVVNCTWLP